MCPRAVASSVRKRGLRERERSVSSDARKKAKREREDDLYRCVYICVCMYGCVYICVYVCVCPVKIECESLSLVVCKSLYPCLLGIYSSRPERRLPGGRLNQTDPLPLRRSGRERKLMFSTFNHSEIERQLLNQTAMEVLRDSSEVGVFILPSLCGQSMLLT